MKNGERMYGLIAGRHNLPVDGYTLESVPDVMDFVAIRDEIYKFVEGACATLVFQNIENGNIHFSFEEMMEEGRKMYDLGDSTNCLDWTDYYRMIEV